MKFCTNCGAEIPAARRAALPATETCIGCSEERKVQGLMVWDGKHTPILEVYAHGKLPPDRKGFHASIGTNSVNNPRMVASVANFNLSKQIKLEAPVAFNSATFIPARCHSGRPKATPDGRCVECAVAYYVRHRLP